MANLNVRGVTPEFVRRLKVVAAQDGMTMNDVCCYAISRYLDVWEDIESHRKYGSLSRKEILASLESMSNVITREK
jgi:hypothetical protein